MKGWFGNRQQHGLASKGIKSSYRRFKGNMFTKDETWNLREQFMRDFGYYDEAEFEKWVLDTTEKTPFYTEYHTSPRLLGMLAFGVADVNEDNLVDYIIEYESEGLEDEDMLGFFSYLIKTGQVWQLQGHYGRTAKAIIDAGYIDESGKVLVGKDRKPKSRKVSDDKELQELYDNLLDVLDYKGKEFTQVYYGGDIYPTDKYPTRSKEIIWEDKTGNQIYLFENTIEYIPKEAFE